MPRGRALLIGLGALGAPLLLSSVAQGSEVRQVAHEIDVELHDTYATVTVQRTVATDDIGDLEAHFDVGGVIPLAATALRTRADDGRWYDAELTDVEDAISVYWQLTGSQRVTPELRPDTRYAVPRPKDPALMLWTAEGLQLFVFPVSDETPRQVEYTLQIPYGYQDGHHVLRIPVGDTDDLTPNVRFSSRPAGAVVTTEGTSIDRGTTLRPTSLHTLDVSIERPRAAQLAMTLASMPVGDRHLTELRLEAAKELGPDPTGTHAVLVLDRSRSLGPESLQAVRAAALAYLDALRAVPGARVEVLLFDRHVEAMHGTFVEVDRAHEALAANELVAANGSDLPAALARAESYWTAAPKGAPRRVIVLSDAKLTADHEAATVGALAAAGGLVHLTDVHGGIASQLEVDDAHRWSAAIRATGGTAWTGRVDLVDGEDLGTFASWVRPTTIDDLTVPLGDRAPLSGNLEAGQGVNEVHVLDEAPRQVTARGWLWGREVEVTARRSTAADDVWRRYAAADGSWELTESEVADLGRRTGAVTPQTALLALEPGAQPGTAVAEDPAPREGRSFNCRFRLRVMDHFGRYSLTFDEASFIRDQTTTAIRG